MHTIKNDAGPILYRGTIVEDGRTLRSVKGTFERVMAWALKNGPRSDTFGRPVNDSRVYVLPANHRMPWEVPACPDTSDTDDGDAHG